MRNLSPIERMIDAACGYDPNKQEIKKLEIKFTCPDCNREAPYDSQKTNLPPDTAIIEIQCPDCSMSKKPNQVILLKDKHGNIIAR